MKKQDFEFLTDLLRQYAGWDFDEKQYFVVDQKISNFIRQRNYNSIEDLIDDLKLGSKSLIARVVENLALSDTSFYRDYDVFQRFENIFLPNLRENNRATKKIRFWSLGCSTGQETYSIAIALKHYLKGIGDWKIDIIGTDISSYAISRAQKGSYSQFDVQRGLNMRQILENFHQENGQWVINDDISSMVEFRRYNLLDELTHSDLYDVIFCRYVLRYFAPDIQQKLIAKIYSRQVSGGFLYLGRGAKVESLDKFYEPVSGMECLFQAKPDVEIPNLEIEKVTTPKDTLERDEDDIPSFVRPSNLSYRTPTTEILNELKKRD